MPTMLKRNKNSQKKRRKPTRLKLPRNILKRREMPTMPKSEEATTINEVENQTSKPVPKLLSNNKIRKVVSPLNKSSSSNRTS